MAKRSLTCHICREQYSKPPPDEGCRNCRLAMAKLNIGATVKMTRHIGALFLYTIVNRIGDDCYIKDARGRIIPNVPVEFLERVGDEQKSVEASDARA